MRAVDALAVVLRGCERLRRLPESRWQRPPTPPLGSRAPNEVPVVSGPSVESRVRAVAAELMADDAGARGVAAFEPRVPVFALADVVAALARSVAARDLTAENAVLASAAGSAAEW
jgi:hypothetical protein